MNKNKLFEKFGYLIAVGISVFLLFFVICGVWIGYEVKNDCQQAERQYGGDCVEALVSLLKDEHQSFRKRNSAIWALGQMGDKRAYATLDEMYTGDMPDREPLDKVISQYELRKAVKLTSGGFNLPAFLWR